ncbi:hypothetical protein J6590_063450 [Homalodisca vitripennis]|nr:hypothetical protein J6590_063450 [Homalodisca vitripennis]
MRNSRIPNRKNVYLSSTNRNCCNKTLLVQGLRPPNDVRAKWNPRLSISPKLDAPSTRKLITELPTELDPFTFHRVN